MATSAAALVEVGGLGQSFGSAPQRLEHLSVHRGPQCPIGVDGPSTRVAIQIHREVEVQDVVKHCLHGDFGTAM